MGCRLLHIIGACVATLAMAALLNAGASWQGQPYTLALPGSFNTRGQSHQASLDMTLQHDAPCALAVTAAAPGNETLHLGTSTLTTQYKLTGAALLNPDGGWVAASTFVTQNYSVQGVGPTDVIRLWVRVTSPSNAAPDAGAYSASIVLTVSW